jgi:hypothetical protein
MEAQTHNEAKPHTTEMARIAQALWNAGLTNYPSDEEILGWCVEYINNDIPLEACTMYTYFRDGEGPRKGGVGFDVDGDVDWKFTIEYLKLLLKYGKLELNGVTVTIAYYDSYATATMKFTDNVKQNIKKLNKLAKLKVQRVEVNADGEIKVYAWKYRD